MTVCVHGFTGSGATWAQVCTHMTKEPSCPTLFGHGAAQHSIGRFEDEVERLAALVTERNHWVGYSMGARLALAVSILAPAKVSRLTLIGANPGLTGRERQQRADADAALAGSIERDGLEDFVNAWQALPLWDSQRNLPQKTLEWQRSIRLSHSAQGLAASLRILGIGTMPSYWDSLREIRVPVHLIHGEHDHKFAVIARMMASHIRTVEITAVPSCGHNPVLESPAVIARLVEEGKPR
jgi:2-succinyl-6-hydroxy-2,4-cyclohexadiene-1-carboxylate synthase